MRTSRCRKSSPLAARIARPPACLLRPTVAPRGDALCALWWRVRPANPASWIPESSHTPRIQPTAGSSVGKLQNEWHTTCTGASRRGGTTCASRRSSRSMTTPTTNRRRHLAIRCYAAAAVPSCAVLLNAEPPFILSITTVPVMHYHCPCLWPLSWQSDRSTIAGLANCVGSLFCVAVRLNRPP